MKDELEFVARALWTRFGQAWNKDRLAKRNQYDDAYHAGIVLPKGRVLEYTDQLLDFADETTHEPAELRYFEITEGGHPLPLPVPTPKFLPLINVQSQTNVLAYSPLKPNEGKRTLEYIVPSQRYEELMRRLQESGPIGQKLASAQRRGNPAIVEQVSAEIQLDNLEGLEEFIYRLISTKGL